MPTPPTPVTIEDLCDCRRLGDATPLQKFLLLLYAPIGLVLLWVRLMLALVFSTLAALVTRLRPGASKTGLIRALLWGFGHRIALKNAHHYFDGTDPQRVVVANHVALTGFWVFGRLGGSIVASADVNLLERLMSMLNSVIVIGNLRNLRSDIQSHFDRDPELRLFISPEGTIGNRRGLFRFQKFAFSLDKPVYPVATRLSVPFGVRIATVAPSRTWSHVTDYLWTFFLPSLAFELDFLPAQQRLPGESPADFGDRVQRLVADRLSIPASHFTPKDKQALRHRLRLATAAGAMTEQRS